MMIFISENLEEFVRFVECASNIVIAFSYLFLENFGTHKGVGVVATPDGVWHRDSHNWRKCIGGVHKIQILIRELLEECLRNFFGEEIGGVRGAPTP